MEKLNEFAAKKLGEVLAFSAVGAETWEKASTTLEKVLPNRVGETIKELTDHAEDIKKLAEESEVLSITTEKAQVTGEKLKQMRDMYIGQSWDDPTELLEWFGFFQGAAYLHWKLIEGVADSTGQEALAELVGRATAFHHDLLYDCSEAIKEVGISQG